jgi:hypothetical protein
LNFLNQISDFKFWSDFQPVLSIFMGFAKPVPTGFWSYTETDEKGSGQEGLARCFLHEMVSLGIVSQIESGELCQTL